MEWEHIKSMPIEDIVTLVSFLTCYKLMGFKYLWNQPPITNNVLLGHLWMAQHVLLKKHPTMGKH